MPTEQLLCWSGTTDTEHSTSSSSNEEDSNQITIFVRLIIYMVGCNLQIYVNQHLLELAVNAHASSGVQILGRPNLSQRCKRFLPLQHLSM